MKQLWLMAVLLFGVHALCQSADNRRLIDALVTMPDPGEVYGDDGAGDGTILRVGTFQDGHLIEPSKAVADIVALKDAAIPLLIDCMSDDRRTSIVFKPSHWKAPTVKGPVKVPVGFVCLDILSSIVNLHPKIFFPDCGDDGMGSCYETGYYFRPEIIDAKGRQRGLEMMHDVQKHWRTAYRKHWIHWIRPSDWDFELKRDTP